MQLRNLRCTEVAHVFDELAYVAIEKNIISRGRKQVNFANELRIKTMQTLWWTQPQVCWVERVLEKIWRGLARGNHRFVHMVNRHLVAYVPSTNLCPRAPWSFVWCCKRDGSLDLQGRSAFLFQY